MLPIYPETEEELTTELKKVRDFIDPFFVAYHSESSSISTEIQKDKSKVVSKVVAVSELPFEKLTIPYYQRPYKWGVKNVNQLIDDLYTFRDKTEYRIGTLVLLENGEKLEIVDGQQRIITLSLLLAELIQRQKGLPSDLGKSLTSFLDAQKFNHSVSIRHIQENYKVIQRRANEIDKETIQFLIEKCKFVTITLNDISEAFQFFDSQNARGKDLEPHDLLKAFHLREIVQLADKDKDQVAYWEKQETEELVRLFLFMYRIKRWGKMKSARSFTKEDVEAFKGLSLNNRCRYPFYQLLAIAHHYVNHYNEDWSREVDGKQLEFPHQLDQHVINGSRFFDMVRHYESMLQGLNQLATKDAKVVELRETLNSYHGRHRTGDKYVRELFDACLLYYMDKYGTKDLDTVIIKIFMWAYSIRLKQYSVQLATIDNYAMDRNGFFVMLRDSCSPQAVVNWTVESIKGNEVKRTEMEELISLFKKFHYYADEK